MQGWLTRNRALVIINQELWLCVFDELNVHVNEDVSFIAVTRGFNSAPSSGF